MPCPGAPRCSRCARARHYGPPFTKSHCAFLILVGLGQRDGTVDPVLQAMVLTGILVAIGAAALARRLLEPSGGMPLPEDRPDASRVDE